MASQVPSSNAASAKAHRVTATLQLGELISAAFEQACATMAVTDDLREVLATGRPLLNRQVVGRPGAPDRVWLSNYYPVRAKDGRPLGVWVVAQDVTERLAAEARLRESEARKSAILETALDCIITIDHHDRILEFNPAAERTFGYGRADVLGRPMAELIVPPALRERHRRGIQHFLATGEGPVLNRRIENVAVRADGTEFTVELAVTPMALDGSPIFTAYLRDITERIHDSAMVGVG